MPELPEVETVRRGLEPSVVGVQIDEVETRRSDIRFPLPAHFRRRLEGKRVLALTRRAKYLLFALDSGETLIAHLGMSGSFRVDREIPGDFHHPRSKDAKHDHVILHMKNGRTITYNDPRRFGFMDLDATATLAENRHLKSLGAEPLSAAFNASLLATLFRGSSALIKTALLDQRRVVGLGNIYVCESLWRAGILPTRPAADLANSLGRPTPAAKALAPAIKSVLEDAVAAGGSTLRDHRQTDGTLGYFQHSFAVYGRAELPCLTLRCSGIIQRVLHSGRSTFWCPVCQK